MARLLGWSDLNRLAERAGALAACPILIPEPTMGDVLVRWYWDARTEHFGMFPESLHKRAASGGISQALLYDVIP